MLGTHKKVVRIKGFIREGSKGATGQLHRTDKKGLVEELCQQQLQDEVCDKMW